MRKYLTDKGVVVNNIQKTSHQMSKFCSFKICIYKTDLHKVYDENFWPNGVYCKRWFDRSEQNADADSNGGNNSSDE